MGRIIGQLVGPKCRLRMHKGEYKSYLHNLTEKVVRWMLYSKAENSSEHRIAAKAVPPLRAVQGTRVGLNSGLTLAVVFESAVGGCELFKFI